MTWDPNTAFENILRDYILWEHVIALGIWLRQDGFAPNELELTQECPEFIKHHCEKHYPHFPLTEIRVRADKVGLWTCPPSGHWISLGIWIDLLREAESHADE